jgi:lysyl endopeptidase
MLRIWIAATLSCASFMACGAAVEGVLKPADAVAKAADTLRMAPAANRSPEIALPGLATQKRLETLEPNQIGVSRKDDVDSLPRITESNLEWKAAGGGYAAHLSIVAPDASGLRVGLRFTALARDLEIRVAEMAADGTPRVVATTTGDRLIKLARGVFPIVHWTATTEGPQQLIELWSPRPPDASALRFAVVNVSHLVQRPLEPVRTKAGLQFTCHVDVSCIADANVTQDSNAVARMFFTAAGGGTFVCTGSLLADRPHSFTPLFATANHCISSQDVASTLETWWFYTSTACNSGTAANPTRLNGGATLLMANFDTDFTLLQLAQSAPGGTFFLGWDGNPIPPGQSVFGLHNPAGTYQRYSSGTYLGLTSVTNDATQITFGQPFKEVEYTQGIVEGGSSGSPLLVLPGIFQGTLFGSPSTNTCNGGSFASYSDFAVGYPLVKTFLDGPNPVDDYGDTPATAGAMSTNAELVADINTDGDQDWFKFTFTQPGQWTVASFDVAPGLGVDVKAEIYAANGSTVLASNDDQAQFNFNFQMSIAVTPGTYYVRVTGAPGVTGRYGLSSIFDEAGNTPATASNALPINGTFSGYLGPLNDQDWFRLTFTQAGTFHVNSTGSTDTEGTLYQSDGVTQIAFDDDIQDGVLTNFTLTIPVSGPGTLYLKVNGFDGQNGAYGLQTTFTPAGTNPNYTDLWWAGEAESGWGVNLNHQSDIIFATLFTYAADHSGLWLVATMNKQADGSYTGPLLQTVGPAFNASPWTGITFTQVGTMTVTFAGTGQGTLVYTVNGTSVTKSIQREVFSTPPTCIFTTASRASATNYQDLWWAGQAESGWGVNFTHQGTIIFATLFTYASDNRGLWLVATMNKQADGSFSGDLLRTTGPAFNAVPWAPPITFTTVGTMRAAFSDGITGTLTYSVDGVPVTKAIQREVFGTAPSVCQ